MINMHCEQCGVLLIDSPRGYITGCEHHKPDIKKPNREERRLIAIARAYDHKARSGPMETD